MESDQINRLFHEMANQAKAAAELKKLDIMLSQVNILKKKVVSTWSVDVQRDELIRRMAIALGLENDPEFFEFMNR